MNSPVELGGVGRLLEKLAAGVILVNSQGLIEFFSPGAQQHLAVQGLPALCLNSPIQLPDRMDNERLQTLLTKVMHPGECSKENPAASHECVVGLWTHSPLMLTIVASSGLQDIVDGQFVSGAAIFISVPKPQSLKLREVLRQSYGLSTRECDLCEAFIQSPDYEHMAEACKLKLASVRTYMKVIYEKTGQCSQAALMKLLMRLSHGYTTHS